MDNLARPRVFVSSTYYDLRHIRNDLRSFIYQYGFEPVLNEMGLISYDHTQPLDESCFHEAQLCDIFILIIGGRYGSRISGNDPHDSPSNQKEYLEKYTSITRKEYRTAYDASLPIYIFVDKTVFTEYRTYQNNKSNPDIQYAYVDNTLIYEFIEEAENQFKNNNICAFDKFEDIASWLREQWAGIFHKYLIDLRNKKHEEKILDSISKLDLVTDNINKMVNEMGKIILNNNSEYENILKEQNKKIIAFGAEQIASNILFIDSGEDMYYLDSEEDFDKTVRLLVEDLKSRNLQDLFNSKENPFYSPNNKDVQALAKNIKFELNKQLACINEKLQVRRLHIDKTYAFYKTEIFPLLNKYPFLEADFKNAFKRALSQQVTYFPF